MKNANNVKITNVSIQRGRNLKAEANETVDKTKKDWPITINKNVIVNLFNSNCLILVSSIQKLSYSN